jgi:uncharacterized protein YuzE
MRDVDIPMQVTYDQEQGYVYLAGRDESRTSAHQVPLDVTCGYEGPDQIVLDFDRQWRLVGIEFGDADRSLPESLLKRVKRG